MNATNTTQTKPPRRRKTLFIVLATIAGTIVAIFATLMIVGLTMDPEEVVRLHAGELAALRGQMDDDQARRIDDVVAEGTTLRVTHTLVDEWRERLTPKLRVMLGDHPSVDQILPGLRTVTEEAACTMQFDLGKETTVIFELRNEAGATLFNVVANSTNC